MGREAVIRTTFGSPTKAYLAAHGYAVWWPLLPNTDNPELTETRGFAERNLPAIDEETIVIAHSSGCPLALHLLERLAAPVKQAILVAGFYQPIGDDSSTNRMLPPSFDWAHIAEMATEIILINSDNDPWGCTDEQARPATEALGAPLIVATGQGHMGSDSYGQPYREFPLLKRLLSTRQQQRGHAPIESSLPTP